ncbi:restriction endonuclease subunit S [Streptococcus suis]|uniref:restriction endonuclease subunit S n=3 Tax=Streptococcus suis TaxID=1307 RepID=UPI0005CCBF80|nr:restriction endonuclease subunit S [Streptococcus suis]MCK3990587.1 restriction endonuclease subunit S [Streptococcus suis]NQG43392.1 restriction endonuclease subunit S [Streptococcus suis]NQH62292.1 restriction endonuclease subunit S [Streptococcus suis]NQJ87813.1 restriction endonuclease subunit S [Streptococcus suis]NQM96137.1 restriction endonuclease subunit S [Streptococcus suis]
MPNKDKNIPKRRFKAFENADAWELRKLGELGTLKNGMNFSKDAMGIGFPFINLQNIFGKNIVDVSQLGLAKASSIQLKNYNLQKGDVLFVRSSVKLEGVGEAAIVPKNLENTTYSGFIIRYRDSFGLDYNFKRFIFGTSNIRNQIMSQATDSANKNISQQVLTELDILVPPLLEQNAIGTFFSILDQQITLHQRKLDKLKNVKQAYLSEMFPAEGERVPKRRFPGFTDAWELRKLKLLFIFKYGDGNNNPSNGGPYPVFGAGGVQGGYTEYNSENSIIIGHMGDAGCVSWGEGKHFVTYNGTITRPKEEVFTAKFGYYLLSKMNLRQYRGGSGLPFLTYDMLNDMDTIVPTNKSECDKISEFFSTLDQQITLHQRKLEKLKNLKKALLNELFV